VKTRTGWRSMKSERRELLPLGTAQPDRCSAEVLSAMRTLTKREEARMGLLPQTRCSGGGGYFFSVSAMIRLVSAAALFTAAFTSPPWIEVTMAAPTASRTSGTATTGGFQLEFPTLKP